MYILLYTFEPSGTTGFVALSEDLGKLHKRADQGAKRSHGNIKWSLDKYSATVFLPNGAVCGSYVIEEAKPL